MRPQVTLHFAQSLDGKIDDPSAAESVRLSNDEGFAVAHRARAEHQAVLVGVNTVLRDDPKLNVRHASGHDPHRVVLDSHLRTPPSARLFHTQGEARVFIVTSEAMRGTEAAARLEVCGATLLFCAPDARGKPELCIALQQLRVAGIERLLVEGGRGVLTAFMAARCVDVLQTEICMAWIGSNGMPPFDEDEVGAFDLADVTTTPLGDHVFVRARPAWERPTRA
jgi:riboflavin-specific deaminase-like protein